MKYPVIDKYVAVDTTDLRNKVIEEWLEVKAFHLLYEKERNSKFRKQITNNFISELHDMAQILSTFAYNALITLNKPTKIDLSINNLLHCTKGKIEHIKDVDARGQLEHILNHSFDFICNIIRIVCLDNDIDYLNTFDKHIKKMIDRGVLCVK